jgi:hypothetical protein
MYQITFLVEVHTFGTRKRTSRSVGDLVKKYDAPEASGILPGKLCVREEM